MLGTPPAPADLQAALSTDRTYLRVRPTATPLRPQAVAQALRTFQPADGWADTPPTLEMLLVAPGDGQLAMLLLDSFEFDRDDPLVNHGDPPPRSGR